MIHVYFSDQAGAPGLTGSAGSLLALLDACLINGYNKVNVAGITYNPSTGLATCVTATPHGFTGPQDNFWSADWVGHVARIDGAGDANLNGDFYIQVVDTVTFNYKPATAPTVTTDAGSAATCRRAPAGFVKPFVGTNVAVYRSSDITSAGYYWYIDDSGNVGNGQGARQAWTCFYESMSSLTSGINRVPLVSQSTGSNSYPLQGPVITKSTTLDGTNYRHWRVFTDGKAVLLQVLPDAGGTALPLSSQSLGGSGYQSASYFGDYLSVAPDAYAAMLCAMGSNQGATSTVQAQLFYSVPYGNGISYNPSYALWLPRRYTGEPTPQNGVIWGHGMIASSQLYTLGSGNFVPYPDGFSNRLYFTRCKVIEPATPCIRGLMPFYDCAASAVGYDRQIFPPSVTGIEGRTLMGIAAGTYNSTSVTARVYLDLTGESNGKWS